MIRRDLKDPSAFRKTDQNLVGDEKHTSELLANMEDERRRRKRRGGSQGRRQRRRQWKGGRRVTGDEAGGWGKIKNAALEKL